MSKSCRILIWSFLALSLVLIGFGSGQSGNTQIPVKPAAGEPAAPREPAESVVSRLAKIGVKAEITPEKELLITEGFPFMKALKAKDVIEIAEVDRGLFTAAKTSAVPTEMMGTVYLVSGGSFFAQLNMKEGERTLADRLGNTWIFQKAGLQFDVYAARRKPPTYNVQSNVAGASIRFSEKGVYLKGFTIKVYPPETK
jgi:hypothetical protein